MERVHAFSKLACISIGIFLFLFIVSNASYFFTQIQYFLGRNTATYSASQSVPVNVHESQRPLIPNQLSIPALNIQAPIVYIQQESEDVYQKALKKGVVHYPNTALPGELGNCYIFGHSSDYVWSNGQYKNIFALLPHVSIGDEITVSNSTGTAFTYFVTKTAIIMPTDLTYLDQYKNQKKMITLQTSYPIGTALKRYIVQAEIK